MMMMGESSRFNPMVQAPPWDMTDDPTANMASPFSANRVSVNFNGNATSPKGDLDALAALHRYLPSNTTAFDGFIVSDFDDFDIPVDAFSTDQFRMFEFKVRKCTRARSHDWTECPYAHPGEKARRRDPRKLHYSGTACPEFRKGQCKKGDSCEFAHGVFECWLHPARYRTQPCKDGVNCRRRVCFFAHTPDQLRVMNESYDGSPSRLGFDSYLLNGSSSPSESPPASPSGSLSLSSVSELAGSMRNLQIGKARMSVSPPGWGFQMGSPRSPSGLRPGFKSLPSTPTRMVTRNGFGAFDLWDPPREEEPAMERVESGRDLRAKIYAKLSKENSLGRVDSVTPGPDIGWVAELVK
ncbi:zinc finger CCCH domain-containing protein 20-like [Diospyros lotus]|uniref:zinc finger CCCH domain-containing protein 20-like n=1 Tax=Diospyros lotus TaxID=55363 RepID=UPI002255423F|nr:zinc finger CCCH domain-containing protein 20-like [Diospyros lotus]